MLLIPFYQGETRASARGGRHLTSFFISNFFLSNSPTSQQALPVNLVVNFAFRFFQPL